MENQIESWQHDHVFGQDEKKGGEKRTLIVIAITAVMMIIEITAGILFGSMALLADGLHMASHTAALAITAFAYYYARKHASDPRFNFGTGKVNALAGFGSAIILGLFALLMVWESIHRFLNPVNIVFNQAILVATIGLVVNAVSALILGSGEKQSNPAANHQHSDHNLRAAYLHVLADALTSVLAIIALLAAKYLGFVWMDPMMGIVGALLISRWSLGLVRNTSSVLLDRQAPSELRNSIKTAIEQQNGDQITDLHVWSIGPDFYAASIAIVSQNPATPEHYKKLIPDDIGVVHATIEINKPA